jgi:hypothetical protein
MNSVAQRKKEPIPFTRRELTPKERKRQDVYAFISPKNSHRLIRVIDPIQAAAALRFEFDPKVRVYVERPRRLALTEHRVIDITFWTQSSDNAELFWLVVPAPTTETIAGRRLPRESGLLSEAAARHGLQLNFIFEAELSADRNRIDACFRLLPFVQAAGSVRDRVIIEQKIIAVVRTQPTQSFRRIEQQLSDHSPADVRAVLAGLVHAGKLEMDLRSPLSTATPLTEGPSNA